MDATSNSVIEFRVFIKLTEGEARALDALAGYGSNQFLKVFYEHLGKHYMQPYEKDLISLFESIRREIPPHISRIDKTRKIFFDENPNQKP